MQQIKLWDREIPYFKEEADTPNNMTFYPVPTWHALPTVVVFPGGGYSHRAAHEGESIAQFFNTQGFHACVVDYRVKPNAYPAPLCDAQRAVKLLRAKAKDLKVDPDRIYTIGFSAGSHLAAYEALAEDCAAYGDEADEMSCVPNGVILSYPMLSPRASIFTIATLVFRESAGRISGGIAVPIPGDRPYRIIPGRTVDFSIGARPLA